MASDARKLVMCFDTVELLQYESSIIEEKAGLDTADTRIKPWLLEKLAQIHNVLVVLLGVLGYQPRENQLICKRSLSKICDVPSAKI